MKAQMIFVISSPSSSTIGFSTLIFDGVSATRAAMLPPQTLEQIGDHRF
jgi:hypothetical protein